MTISSLVDSLMELRKLYCILTLFFFISRATRLLTMVQATSTFCLLHQKQFFDTRFLSNTKLTV